MTKNQAETAIKRAWIACLASVLVCIATIALVIFASISYVYGPKPWNLSDQLAVVFIKLLIILGLGYGLYRRSRFFATALFVLFCVDHLAFLIFDAEWWSWAARAYWLFLIIVFGYIFLQGVHGAFVYQQAVKQEATTDRV